MLANLILATAMVALTVMIHFIGLAVLMMILSRRARGIHQEARIWRQGAALVAVVFGLFAVHTIEIWTYAALYRFLGEFDTFETALYFSASTFTTVGFGDIFLDERWRLLSAIESANGFLLIGWSTAFLISVTARLRALELELTERREEAADRSSGQG